MNVVEIVKAIDAYYEDLSNELPEPPAEVHVNVDAPVVEAPTIEEYIAPKAGDVIVVDDPRYNYYKTTLYKEQRSFALVLSDALSKLDNIEHESMVHGDESYVILRNNWLPALPGYKFPKRIHNEIIMEVYIEGDDSDVANNTNVSPSHDIKVRECKFFINQLPEKIQTTLKKLGVFKYDGKTGIPRPVTLQV